MIKREVVVNDKKIIIEQNLDFGHAGTVWDGALVLVHHFNHQKQIYQGIFQNKSVIELGAGTGLAGLAAGCFNPSTVVLTDFKQNLPVALRNIEINYPNDDRFRAEQLAWGDQQSMSNLQDKYKPDILLGSELAYDEENVKLLIGTIEYFQQQNPKLITLISFQKYQKATINLQQALKSRGFPYKTIPWNLMDPDFRDSSIGIISLQPSQ